MCLPTGSEVLPISLPLPRDRTIFALHDDSRCQPASVVLVLGVHRPVWVGLAVGIACATKPKPGSSTLTTKVTQTSSRSAPNGHIGLRQ